MNLTKEDQDAIRAIVKQTINVEMEPVRKALKEVINSQVDIVEKHKNVDEMMYLILRHMNLSPVSRDLKNSLHKLG